MMEEVRELSKSYPGHHGRVVNMSCPFNWFYIVKYVNKNSQDNKYDFSRLVIFMLGRQVWGRRPQGGNF